MLISSNKSFILFMILVDLSTSFYPSISTESLRSGRAIRPLSPDKCLKSTYLHLSNLNDEEQTQKSLSASQKERREEDRRRKARLQEGFATPGLSSALPGARDFALNIAQTEREYLQSLSSSDDDSVIDDRNVDKYVALWTEEGLSHLRMLRFKEASELFNKVYQIKPDAYLWQDGLVKYYLEDYHGAAESLAKNAIRFETRFLSPASEERIWRDAAELKIVYSLNGGRMAKNDAPATVRVTVEDGMNEDQSEKMSIVSERR
jgi:tetratricopeptide (TPR) repeat protein